MDKPLVSPNSYRILRNLILQVTDCVVLLDREQGAAAALSQAGVRVHSLLTITRYKREKWGRAGNSSFSEPEGRMYFTGTVRYLSIFPMSFRYRLLFSHYLSTYRYRYLFLLSSVLFYFYFALGHSYHFMTRH